MKKILSAKVNLAKTGLLKVIIGILFISCLTIFTTGTTYGSNSTFNAVRLPPTCITNLATNVTYNSARLNGSVNPNGLFTIAYFNYGKTTSYGINAGYQFIFGTTPVNVSDTTNRLSASTQYNFRVVGTSSTGTTNGNNQIFITPGIPPTCITTPAINITYNSAKLNGCVNPNRSITTAYFQWGTTASYGNTTTSQSIGSGTSYVVVTANISGLSASTRYNFRVVGINTNGTTYGNNLHFTTRGLPPTCTTNPATNITYNSARLNGTVNPNGFFAIAYFNYGKTTSYGINNGYQLIFGTNPVNVSATIAGLSFNTLYNFRVVGTNANGTTYGNDLTFTTPGILPNAPSNLIATAVSSSQINLTWTDNSINETDFKIERKTGVSGTYAQIATVDANVTSYSNIGLSTSTTYYYRVRAYNANGNSLYSNEASATTFSINAPPVMTSPGNKVVDENVLLIFILTASDPNGDPLIYSAGNLPTGATFTPASRTFSWIPTYNQANIYPNVTFTVTDSGGLTDSKSITITVNNVDRPPVLTSPGNKVIDENQLLTFTLSATDPDNDTIIYSMVNTPTGATLNYTTGVFSWTPTYSQSGSYIVTFTATANLLADTKVISITVNNVDRPPVLTSSDDKTIDENQLLTFTLSATDPDEDIISYSMVGTPTGSTLNSNSGVFSWTPDYTQSGSYVVIFTATANLLTDTKTITIIVNDVDITPPTGTISINNGAIATSSTAVTLSLSANDPESGVSQMRFSNDNVTWYDWENYAITKEWNLSADEGNKTVYVEYKNGAGLTSVFSDTIIFDTPPDLSIDYPTEGITITNLSQLYFDASYADAFSGIDETSLEVLLNNITITNIFIISPSSATYYPMFNTQDEIDKFYLVYGALNDGTNELIVRIKDNAGNITGQIRNFYVTLGTIEPPPPPPPPPALRIGLEIVSGNNQEGLIGRCANNPLVVRAYNLDNPTESIEGIPLLFEITQGGGIFVEQSGYSTVTNVDGKGALHYHFGMEEMVNKVRVSVLGDSSVIPVEFSLVSDLPRVKMTPGYEARGIILVNDSGKSELVIRTTASTEIRQAVGTLLNEILVPDSTAVDLVPSSLYTTGYSMFSLVGRKVGTYTREITLPEFPKFILIRYDNNGNLVEEKVASYRETITISERDEKGLKSAIIDGNGQVGISGTELAKPLKIDISEYINYNKTNFIPYAGLPYNYLRSSFALGCTDGCYLLKTETGWSKEIVIFTEGVASVYVKVTSTQPLSGIWLRGITSEFMLFPQTGQPYIATFTLYPRTRCYAIPPEIRFVRQSGGSYNEISQLPTYGIFDRNWQIQSVQPEALYNVEYLLPSNYSGTPSLTLQTYNECKAPITETGRAVAPLTQNITLTKVEDTDRFSRYRSGPIQNTQELFQPNMEKIVITSGLPQNQTLMQARVGGLTNIEDTTLGITKNSPNEGIFFADYNGLRTDIISEIDYNPSTVEPTFGISYLMEYDNQSTNPSKVATIQSPTGIDYVTLNRFQTGLYRSEKPIVVADVNLNLSGWPYLNQYTVVRTTSDTSNNMELSATGSGDTKAKVTEPALVFYTLAPVRDRDILSYLRGKSQNTPRSRYDEIVTQIKTLQTYTVTDCLKEQNSTKQTIFMTQSKLGVVSPYAQSPYYLGRYGLVCAFTHGLILGTPYPGTWSGPAIGLSLGYYDSAGNEKYGPLGVQITAEIPTGSALLAAQLNNISDLDFRFVFLGGCSTAYNDNFDTTIVGNNSQVDPVINTLSDNFIRSWNTHAYLGWQNTVDIKTAVEMATELFKAHKQLRAKNNKAAPIKQAFDEALKNIYAIQREVTDPIWQEARPRVWLRIGNECRTEPASFNPETYSIDSMRGR
ncbi:MAG: putative Ig domain-containing protein [Planctomycetota bacterium]